MELKELKSKIFALLKEDEEFRYAVAGMLGLNEILRRLDRHEAELIRLREDFNKMREDFNRMREDFNRMREDFNRMYRQIDIRLARVERTLEKITLDIEEEARVIVKHRLREMGYEIEISSLILPEAEINIYGASDETCIIGEARVRASSGVIDEINKKITILEKLYPDKVRPKIIKVIYTSLAMPDLVEKAKKEGIWILKATGDITKPPKP